MTFEKRSLMEDLGTLKAKIETLKAEVAALVQEVEATYGAPTPAVLEKLYGPRH